MARNRKSFSVFTSKTTPAEKAGGQQYRVKKGTSSSRDGSKDSKKSTGSSKSTKSIEPKAGGQYYRVTKPSSEKSDSSEVKPHPKRIGWVREQKGGGQYYKVLKVKKPKPKQDDPSKIKDYNLLSSNSIFSPGEILFICKTVSMKNCMLHYIFTGGENVIVYSILILLY